MATNNCINNKSEPLTSSTVYATTFDTNVAAAGVTLAGSTLAADGSDADINITVTPKGTGVVSTAANINAAGISFDAGTTTLANYVTTTAWTPTISFNTGTTGITYDTQSGTYSRIGNICFIRVRIILTSKGSSSGNLRITSLPINPAASTISYLSCLLGNVTFAGETLLAYAKPEGYILVYFSGNSSETATVIDDGDCENGTTISIGGFYFV